MTFRDSFYRVCVVLGFAVTCQKSELLCPSSGSENEWVSCAGGDIVGSALIWGHCILLAHVERRDLRSGSEFKRPGKTYKCYLDTGDFSHKKYFHLNIAAFGVTRPKL